MMKCENHPDLRWHCKMQAVSKEGRYTGARNIFFSGKMIDGKLHWFDPETDEYFQECPCSGQLLIATDMEYVRKWHEEDSAR